MTGLFERPASQVRPLRDYQVEAIERLRDSFRRGNKRPIMQAPTGFGKTRLAGEVLKLARNKGKRVMFCVPRIDLVDQTLNSFWSDGIEDIGVIQASHAETDYSRPAQIASVQTLIKRGFPPCDLVVIDECHLAFEKIHAWMDMPEWRGVPFIGLSATPWTKGLGKHYDDLIIAGTTQDMIEAGHLSPFRVFAPSHPDLKDVKVRMGDYVEGDLSKAMNKATLVADIVRTWLEKAERRPTLVFAVDRDHAKHLQKQFEEAGVRAGYQDAYTKPDERAALRRGFHDGTYEVVVNIGTLTTGVDWDVRCIVLARPTRSEILFTQIIGRGLRTAEGKPDCLILDHSDTTSKLGFVTDIHHEELDMGDHAPPEPKKAPLPKECPACAYLRPPSMTKCPNCGFEPEHKIKAPTPQDGELQEVTRTEGGIFKRRGGTRPISATQIAIGSLKVSLVDFYGQLKRYSAEKGYKEGWAAQKYKSAVGKWPEHGDVIPPRQIDYEVASWIRSQNIRFAKGQKARDAATAY